MISLIVKVCLFVACVWYLCYLLFDGKRKQREFKGRMKGIDDACKIQHQRFLHQEEQREDPKKALQAQKKHRWFYELIINRS
jgi:hypothetical protein